MSPQTYEMENKIFWTQLHDQLIENLSEAQVRGYGGHNAVSYEGVAFGII